MENIGAMQIDYDKLEKIFKKKYFTYAILVIVLLIFTVVFFTNDDYFLCFFGIQAFLIFPFLPNYLFLNSVLCPKCERKYFTPFLADKNDIKSLLKSNPKCASCNYEAEVISEYKTMY